MSPNVLNLPRALRLSFFPQKPFLPEHWDCNLHSAVESHQHTELLTMSLDSYQGDAVIALQAFIVTAALDRILHRAMSRAIPEWALISKVARDRIPVEMALIPSRITLFILTGPLVRGAFKPPENWDPRDTDSMLKAWYGGLVTTPMWFH